MSIEKIQDYIETASKADIILTIAIVVIVLGLIVELFSIGMTVRKTYKIQKTNFDIIAKEFARINPNQYVTSYATDTNEEKNTDAKMPSL